ncbi:MAG: DUF3231 family protein [Bacillota bacterium]|nr:DUF3231 family protein [Bacillota bacterium]
MGNIDLTESDLTNIVKKTFEGNTDSKERKTTLTASEAANLWNQYLGDSSSICMYTFYHKHTQDKDIQSILEFALQLSKLHIKKITDLFNQADYPIPIGYTLEDDVNFEAPRIFSEPLIIYDLEIMTIHGITAYSLAISACERDDIRNYYIECSVQASELLNKLISLSKSRGNFDKSPVIPPPQDITFVEKKGLISDLLADPKPLNVMEISNLFFNVKKTILLKVGTMAFSQIAQHDDVRKFLAKAADQSDRSIRSLSALLQQDNLPTPHTWEADVFPITISPFSDKLMMFHIGFKMSAAIAYYGTGLATSMRADVIATYAKLMTGLMSEANEWLNLMVKYRWLEQQPQAVDRKALSQR